MSKYSGKEAKRYSPQSQFAVQDLIEHAQFGIGIVSSVGPKKITALFVAGARVLVHNL